MNTHPPRQEFSPAARARDCRSSHDDVGEYTNPSVDALAAELAALGDEELAEQVGLLVVAAQYGTLAPLVLPRLRLAAAELARRLTERKGVRR